MAVAIKFTSPLPSLYGLFNPRSMTNEEKWLKPDPLIHPPVPHRNSELLAYN